MLKYIFRKYQFHAKIFLILCWTQLNVKKHWATQRAEIVRLLLWDGFNSILLKTHKRFERAECIKIVGLMRRGMGSDAGRRRVRMSEAKLRTKKRMQKTKWELLMRKKEKKEDGKQDRVRKGCVCVSGWKGTDWNRSSYYSVYCCDWLSPSLTPCLTAVFIMYCGQLAERQTAGWSCLHCNHTHTHKHTDVNPSWSGLLADAVKVNLGCCNNQLLAWPLNTSHWQNAPCSSWRPSVPHYC